MPTKKDKKKLEYNWQLVSFLELVNHCQGKERWEVHEDVLQNYPSNDAASYLMLSDNTVVASVTDHEPGYSEYTPSGPASMFYYIGTLKGS